MMTDNTANILICGAGIAGIAAAYHLSVGYGVDHIVIVDERPPLTLTSDKSTEAYRNWWPGPDDAMIRLMNRSIDLMEDLAEESGNRFLMNRRGYVYASARQSQIEVWKRAAEGASRMGAGPLRVHEGRVDDPAYEPHHAEDYRTALDGADLILDRDLIHRHFPYVADDTLGVLHARRCGWFSGQQLGMLMLEEAQTRGVRLVTGRVESIVMRGGRFESVKVATGAGMHSIAAGSFVNAAGPMVQEIGQMMGIDVPIVWERHVKMSIRDHLGIVPRDAPLLIWDDPQVLDWSEDEREALQEMGDDLLLGELPAGVHMRPEGADEGQNILMLWPYDVHPSQPTFPVEADPMFAEVALRGMARMIPGLSAYSEQMPRPYIDGGYYTKTAENRLLSGPLPVERAFMIGALSGYGLMAAPAAGELLAAHITGSDLADYAQAFMLSRYDDPAYQKRLEDWGPSAQL